MIKWLIWLLPYEHQESQAYCEAFLMITSLHTAASFVHARWLAKVTLQETQEGCRAHEQLQHRIHYSGAQLS